MQNSVIYCRVSTEDQANHGVSLDAQKAKGAAWAQANGYAVLAVHVDAGISGSKADNRPGLQAALADACQHKAALVVYSLSRLARSTKDTLIIGERLEKAGADLVSLSERIDTTTAAGKMLFRLLAVLAEFERDLVSERTSNSLQFKRRNHELVGEVPYGYSLAEDKKTLIPNEDEQTLIRKAVALHAKGRSYSAIARLFTACQYKTKQGNSRWWPQVIRKIVLANKTNAAATTTATEPATTATVATVA